MVTGHSLPKMPTYLEALTLRLATGVAELPEEFRARHASYLALPSAATAALPDAKGAATCTTRALPAVAGDAGRAIWRAGRTGGGVFAVENDRAGVDC